MDENPVQPVDSTTVAAPWHLCADCVESATEPDSTPEHLYSVSHPFNNTTTSVTGVVWVAAYWPAFIQHPEAQQTTQVGVWLRLVLLPVILLAGFLGNGLTVALMRRPGMRRNSYSPYLTALAACDSVALLVRLAFWLNLLASTLQRSVLITFRSLVACALVEYVCTTNHVLCSWLVVVLTVERLVVVVLPLKSARFVTSSNSVKVVAAMAVSFLLLMIYIVAVVRWVPGAGGCVISFPRHLHTHFALATTFVSLLPLLLICCGNLVIVVVLYLQSRDRARLLAGSATQTAVKGADGTRPGRSREEQTDRDCGSPGSQQPRSEGRMNRSMSKGQAAGAVSDVDVAAHTVGYSDDTSLIEEKLCSQKSPKSVSQRGPKEWTAGSGRLSSQGTETLSTSSKLSATSDTTRDSADDAGCPSPQGTETLSASSKPSATSDRTSDSADKAGRPLPQGIETLSTSSKPSTTSDRTIDSADEAGRPLPQDTETLSTSSKPSTTSARTKDSADEAVGLTLSSTSPLPHSKESTNSSAATKKPATNTPGKEQQVRRVTFTLLCVSLTFLVLVMPNALVVLGLGFRPDWAFLQPLLDPLALLWDGNFAVNFYLYVLAGANFRAEVFKMIGCTRTG